MEEGLNKGQMKKDILSIVNALSLRPTLQRPNTVQKHASIRCTMLNTQKSHEQRFNEQICSLWSSILVSKSLPVVTLV